MRADREDLQGHRRALLRLIGCGALAALAPGCQKPLSTDECGALLDHYVELLVQADRPDAGGGEVTRLQSTARAKAAQDPAFSRCSSEVTRRQFECAMKASNPDQLEQCLL
ncbi:MAG: hypothetical protein OZ921_16510 [Sorangiineae bacterium]|nr:hypothetical protein [Polyangiaceae bacterium]MEB2324117.1 hypothetical protein [Sorangiineae bacterium]